MVQGFNHNIKHNDLVYHIQTEDSGAANPHITTHLFVGGNILATKKTNYADTVEAENLEQIVRDLMENQHKTMLRNLIHGVYDGLESSGVRPATAAKPETPPAQVVARQPASASASFQVQVVKAGPVVSVDPPIAADRPAPSAPPPIAPIPAPAAASPKASPSPALASKPAPPAAQPRKFPPAVRPIQVPLVARAVPDPKPALSASGEVRAPLADEEGNLPPEVLAARRLGNRPTPKQASGPTIFGENLVSEKSLDEVILGYLYGEDKNAKG